MKKFLKLIKINKTKSLSENVFLTNFNKLSTQIKPSTLWSIYSMLKSMKNTKHNINVGTYFKLQVFFKEKMEWIKSFEFNRYKKFIEEALMVKKVGEIKLFCIYWLLIFRSFITIYVHSLR
jgi:hypothetical protein